MCNGGLFIDVSAITMEWNIRDCFEGVALMNIKIVGLCNRGYLLYVRVHIFVYLVSFCARRFNDCK